ncbi:TAXI family TRAP transporter solute-binding subunit [Neptunomonas sp.]|uniref:TAXI family TRAP transporter solute-binding subunit n=1 Tax=Neptunomonas sp. TaxID=1971898 RepID=UPI003565EF8A
MKFLMINKRRAMLSVSLGLLLSCSAIQASVAETFRMSTLGPGTSPYMVMTTFATTINKNIPEYSIVVNATGAATKHQLDTAKGKTDFYMSSPIIVHLMKNQEAMYKKIKDAKSLSENLRAVLNFPMGFYHGTVYESSGITNLEGIKGKRVFAGPPGGASRRTVEQMIQAVTGYEPGEDYTSVKLGWDSAAQAFQDGNLDVYFNPTNAPSPVISQIALTNKIRFIGIPEEDIANNEAVKNLIKRPGYQFYKLKVGTYGENQLNTEDVYTLGVTVGIGTHKDVPDEMIYRMTKTFWENLEEQYETSPWLRNISLKTVFDDLNMPLHPGAEKYYREIGILN